MKQNGFTLVEILVAVTILLILGGTAIRIIDPWQWTGKARVARAQSEIEALKNALSLYKADNFALPTQRQGLEALVAKPSVPPVPRNWREGGYLENRTIPADPWGNPYVYLSPGSSKEPYEIISFGADGAPGGEGEDADLSSSR